MFDFGFSELMLVFVIGLVVLDPTRLPVVVKTVMSWVKTLRSLATTVQNELTQEIKVMELQDKLKKLESVGTDKLTPELKSSLETLRQATESLKEPFKNTPASQSTIGKVQPKPVDESETVEPELTTSEKAS